ncbi:amino acid ABC transporter substrate-binding protein, PAAT family [Rhizobium sp. RU20A]|uniref:substrate-binding periplasmic protein n=1 Tax=Rhizobium sp. RU20A TaxID=1907412 RepID=UPI000955687E|nr:transporter substrate-binding domain-containing protein [Rhizobium sp. RU20A]SIQ26671.1 amino acid ABC transporter substrate-binding protein, PAAT family [Rhizobium sp. RU20A]
MKALAAALLLLAAPGFAAKAEARETLTFLTEDYRPVSFEEGGEIKGVVVDQAREIAASADVDVSVRMMPWARAYKLALVNKQTCVLGAARTPHRDRLFKWIEPVGYGTTSLVRLSGTSVVPKIIAEARDLSVGVQRGDVVAEVLAAEGFSRLDISADFDTSLRKLMSGRVALIGLSDNLFEALKEKYPRLEKALPLTTMRYGIACNKAVDSGTVARLNAALAKLIAAGRQNEIFNHYGIVLSR